ncbi:uncharacterized protein JCM6883_003837 [Sporobolomyces salmoneus]|uniref:uncharacterized protein n=1 Tax=Sporobolomyces salmoneus TaxID=183962 RepID=UPI00316FAD7B
MPIPIIPPEITSAILSHFRLEDDGDTENDTRAIEAVGKATSLVCRNWRPLGQALRWREISIKPSSASSLHDHLGSYPHLRKLIEKLTIQSPPVSEEEDQEQERDEVYEPSFELLTQLPELRFVNLNLRKCENLTEGVILCSTLPKLEYVNLLGMALRITSELKTALLKGFPVLKYLGLHPFGLIQTDDSAVTIKEEEEEENAGAVSTSPRSSLHQVALLAGLSNGADPAMALFKVLRSAFNWSTVRVCRIGGLYLVEEILLDLVRQPNLVRLEINPIERDLEELFSTIVAVLPHMKHVKFLEVTPSYVEEDILVSPVEIWDFLDLIPPNLKVFALPQIAFDPDDFYEFPTAMDFEMQGKEPHRVFMTLASQDRPLLLYEFETEEGKEWYQRSGFEDSMSEGSLREDYSEEDNAGDEDD